MEQTPGVLYLGLPPDIGTTKPIPNDTEFILALERTLGPRVLQYNITVTEILLNRFPFLARLLPGHLHSQSTLSAQEAWTLWATQFEASAHRFTQRTGLIPTLVVDPLPLTAPSIYICMF